MSLTRWSPANGDRRECALTSGVNVIDTSTNYGDGLSEELVGETLEEMIADNALKREVY